MKPIRQQKGLAIAIMLGIFLMILGSCLIMAGLVPFSGIVAETFSEVDYIRLPILILAEIMVAIFILNLVLGEVVLAQVIRNSIFPRPSARIIKWIGACFLLGIIPIAAIIGIVASVGGSMPNVYLFLVGGIYFALGIVFWRFGRLIDNDKPLKEDVDRTV